MPVVEEEATSVLSAARFGRPRAVSLVGQLDENQGRLTFTGRMTLDQFCDLTIVHNRRWADDAGISMDLVTQREIIEQHANGLALFMVQGLVRATRSRVVAEELPDTIAHSLERIQGRVGETAHYGLPQVTLVLQDEPQVKVIKDDDGTPVAARLLLPAGKLFAVADGQHRREAARRVRDFLHYVIGNRRTPRGSKLYPAEDAPLSAEDVESWVAVQETFRSTTVIAYEAHLGLTIDEARQLFTNFNCHVRPVKADLNLEFDQSNPVNRFAKTWLKDLLAANGGSDFDLRALSVINGFLFLGKTSIKQAPYDTVSLEPAARKFWELLVSAKEWSRENSRLREVAVLKGLAKAWFMVYLARRNNRLARANHLTQYIVSTTFDDAWVETVPGLKEHTVLSEEGGWRFSPAHNDIVGAIVRHLVG